MQQHRHPRATYDTTKRLMDLLGAGLGMILVLPILAVCAVLIRLLDGSPILYRQQRPGLHGKPFVLLKFRTMHVDDGMDLLSEDASRITRLGNILRRSSLDELPTLWNVLKGDLSLVGPRPLLMQYLDRYTSDQARRHDVRPGITGLAQINGRNAVSWDERLALDVWYVDNRSLGLDLSILAKTVREVLSGRGVNAPGHATMPEFMGDGGE